jgi:predicted permease
MLLAGAGLLMKSFIRLLSVDPGFNTRGLLTIDIELPENKYAEVAPRAEFVRNVLARLENVPGVSAAAAINVMPMTKNSPWNGFKLPGASEELGEAGFRAVTPGYFEAMGIPLIRGRLPARGDRGVGVINQSMARRYWPNEDPVGKVLETPRIVRVRTPQGWDVRFIPEQFQIVGVVGDVRHLSLDYGARPEMFLLYSQMAPSDFTLLLRSSVDRAALERAARKEIWAVDRNQPLAAVRTMDQLIGQDVANRRFVLLLLMVFAAVAVSLAAAGIFAVIAHSVSQRTREIGIRMALGADAPAVIRTMVWQTLLWVGAGLTAGAAGALVTGRLLGSYLFAVQPRDPAVLAIAVTGLAAVAVLAAFVPARDAARVDPAITLRCE